MSIFPGLDFHVAENAEKPAVLLIEAESGLTLAQFPNSPRGIADCCEVVKRCNAYDALVAAAGYISEQTDLDTPRLKDADDSDYVSMEVTVGWLRELRDALEPAKKEST